jgi:Fe-S cluster assembly protein SufB
MSVDLDLSKYSLGWSDEEDYVFKPKRGSTSRSSGRCRG